MTDQTAFPLTAPQQTAIENGLRELDPDRGTWPSGEQVAVIAEATVRTTPFWVLSVDHRHGGDTSLHRSAQDAQEALYRYVVQWWPELAGTENVPAQPPQDHEEAITLYFDQHGSEFYGIEQLTVG